MIMASFTFGSEDARAAVVAAMRAEDEPFTATFTASDSRTVFRALRHVSVLSPDLREADDLASRFAGHLGYLDRSGDGGKLAVVWSADQVRVVLDALCGYWQDNACGEAGSLASGIAGLYGVEWV